jgi:hypothetical protein
MRKPPIFLLSILGFTFVLVTCATASASRVSSANYVNDLSRSMEPNWVRDPYSKYDRQVFIAAVGMADSRAAAEKKAIGSLIAIFDQNIQVDEKLSTSYQETVKNGAIANRSENTTVDTAISVSTGMSSLIGVEIGDVWNDGKNSFYAVAFLNKAKASQVYSEMVMSNQAMIDSLVNIPIDEKNTMNGLARYQYAAKVADMTKPYLNLLSVIGGSVPAFKSGNDYRLEASIISKAIPVGIIVQNDKSGRIHVAFAKAFYDLGFVIGGDNSPYLLEANVITAPAVFPNNPNGLFFTRIALNADLKDAKAGTVLLSYSFITRDGHTTQEEADNHVYMTVERQINREYATKLNNYLSRLLPEK